jgi:hypothetical protein
MLLLRARHTDPAVERASLETPAACRLPPAYATRIGCWPQVPESMIMKFHDALCEQSAPKKQSTSITVLRGRRHGGGDNTDDDDSD